MSVPYAPVATNNYNLTPPPDDGSTVSNNIITWAGIKGKLADPVKTALEANETALVTAFTKVVGGAGITSVSTDYSVGAADQAKLIKVTASGHTITTPDATSVGAPFVFAVVNNSSGNTTLAGFGGTQTIDGASAGVNVTIPAGNGCLVYTDGSNWFTAGQNFTTSFPPVGAFKNLSIKVTSNTAATVAADFVTVSNGSGKYQTVAVNQSINFGTTGAGALDQGTVAIDTWYHIWVVVKPDGTVSAVASKSTDGSNNGGLLLPTGYTFSGRVGAVRTIHASATLFGTWQFGRQARYVVGLAQTANLPIMATGSAGNVSTPTWVAIATGGFVPTTASMIFGALANANAAGGTEAMIAPNNGYGGISSSSNPPPCSNFIGTGSPTIPFSFLLESTNIYWAASGALLTVATGWEDNI